LENRLRLAPSPTGSLHIGTARTALFNWLYAKKTNGKFLIRIEDTDINRSREKFTTNILNGLKWLGLDWDEDIIKQSNRIDIHKSMIKQLLDKGLAYRCFTTEEESEKLREKQKEMRLPPKHDNRHRNLTANEIDKYISEGKTSVIRFKIEEDVEIEWNDLIRGEIQWLGKDLGGDMVLSRRANGYEIGEPLYNLAVVVDDNFMNITHVVRGEDHISNTAKQILLYKALGFNLPSFSHTPLILNTEGKKLSKRDSVTSIDEFKDMGYLPEAMSNYMALLGWSPNKDQEEILSLDQIAKNFNLKNINKSGAKFDWEKLNWVNAQYIKSMSRDELHKLFKECWKKEGWSSPSEEWGLKLTCLAQDSVTVINDVVYLSKPFFETPEITDDALNFLKSNDSKTILKLVLGYLNNNKKIFNNNLAKEILNSISKEHGIKKGLLMRSLRMSFFRCLNGPDLIESWELLSLIGEDNKRIREFLEVL